MGSGRDDGGLGGLGGHIRIAVWMLKTATNAPMKRHVIRDSISGELGAQLRGRRGCGLASTVESIIHKEHDHHAENKDR